MTGRKPFEYISPDAAVIQKVLGGTRPDRPVVGFSDALWTLLTQTWFEEFEYSEPSIRPDTTKIIQQLQDDAENWNPTSNLLSPPTPIVRKTSCMSSAPSEPTHAVVYGLIITAASSTESSTFSDQLVGHTGLFSTFMLVNQHVLNTVFRRRLRGCHTV